MRKYKNISYSILLLFTFFQLSVKSQQNLIPNGGFESNSWPSTTCDGNTSTFDNNVLYWGTADHSDDNGAGSTSGEMGADIVFFNQCSMTDCHCANNTINLNPSSGEISNAYARIRANVANCSGNPGSNFQHEAIGVSLENGASLFAGVTYILRYKICPIRAETQSNDTQTCGYYNTDDSNIRFFLSKYAAFNWQTNNSVQELYAANYYKELNATVVDGQLATACNWEQVEKTIVPSDNNYKTLVIYAQSGGALIDDVELYQQCREVMYVQKRTFGNVLHGQNKVSGYNHRDKAWHNLLIGNNVDPSMTPTGNVIVKSGAYVNFTAEDEVRIYDGFEAQLNSEVKIINTDCEGYYNREMGSENNGPIKHVNINSKYNENQNEKYGQIKISPNPGNGIYSISNNALDAYSVNVYDMRGLLIKSLNENNTDGKIDISNFNSGIYIFVVQFSDGTNKSIKVIKE